MTGDDVETRPVALVTGARRGIGAAICRRLAASEMCVVANDLVGSDLSAGAGSATDDPPAATQQAGPVCDMVVLADAADPDDVARMVGLVVERFGRLDVLVNNAAITAVHKPWVDVTPAELWDVLRVNLAGPFLCAQAAHQHLGKFGRGRIVNIASTAVLLGGRNMLHYVSAKSGLIGMTRSLARELGSAGITVNTVCPGAIQTEAEMVAFPDQAAIAAELAAVQAVTRRGRPADIGDAVAFLASEGAGFITGQLLNVDGGWVMH